LSPSLKPVRPRQAATLVLLEPADSIADETRVLMGRRAPKHDFLPDVFVFPGGRVDQSDRGQKHSAQRLDATVAGKIGGTANQAHAIALAAIRETFEETGLALLNTECGKAPTILPHRPQAGERSTGKWPGLDLVAKFDVLDYIGRAITPSISPKRFDTHFFAADAGHARGEVTGNGELLDLNWYPLSDALKLPLVDVTEFILEYLTELLAGGAIVGPGFCPAVPFYSWRSRGWVTRWT
jgi:8-oxo-dGTP pyrophosphatase MutT (NUDIX family)